MVSFSFDILVAPTSFSPSHSTQGREGPRALVGSTHLRSPLSMMSPVSSSPQGPLDSARSSPRGSSFSTVSPPKPSPTLWTLRVSPLPRFLLARVSSPALLTQSPSHRLLYSLLFLFCFQRILLSFLFGFLCPPRFLLCLFLRFLIRRSLPLETFTFLLLVFHTLVSPQIRWLLLAFPRAFSYSCLSLTSDCLSRPSPPRQGFIALGPILTTLLVFYLFSCVRFL